MSSEGLRRPITFTAASVAAIALAYLAYQRYKNPQSEQPPSPSLHRSNAQRHPHRRRVAREPENSPIDDALQVLSETQQGIPRLGQYAPELPEEAHTGEGVSLDLIPSNLRSLYSLRESRHPEWDESRRLEEDVMLQCMLIQRLVRKFWPEGTLVSANDKLTLVNALGNVGIHTRVAAHFIDSLNRGRDTPMSFEQVDGAGGQTEPVQEDIAEDAEEDENDETLPVEDLNDAAGSQNMLNLLFNIAGDQAKREGYIHRGIECNGCGVCPIHGIRYHCANCFDYDLCETCESQQVHTKSHVFYKVRIPAPSRGQIKQVLPKWYPGNPNLFPHSLEKVVVSRLVDQTGTDRTEIEALFEQFKCLAGHEYTSDPCHIGMAIDRKGFDLYFVPGSSGKSAPANLIYDRIFGFYDTNDDGLIGFDEFIRGLSRAQDKSRMARLRRIFEGYDLDGDKYVCRKDFLRMFRAYYDLSRQLNREMINAQEDFGYLDEEIREVVQGSQPISAAFGGSTLFGHESRGGGDKRPAPNGDLQISNGPNGVLQNDLDTRGDRYRAIGNAAIGNRPRSHPFRTFRTEPTQDEQLMQLPLQNNFELIGIQHADDATEDEINGPSPPVHPYGWPPLLSPESDDVIAALGAEVPIDDITDPVDRTRVIFAQSQRLDADSDRYQDWQREKAAYERWKRRQFYLDEEEGYTKPQGYTEPDSSDEESEAPKPEPSAGSRRQSLRSRSSSKVRFDDSAIDTDYETRSNASSRSMPQNERWGGYELSQPEFDVGRDVLYEAVQQGFNELLDGLFKDKETEYMDATSSRRERTKWKNVLDEYAEKVQKDAENKDAALEQADQLRTEEIFAATDSILDTTASAEPAAGQEAGAEASQGPPSTDEALQDGAGQPNFTTADVKEAFGEQIKIAIAAAVSNVKEASLLSRPPEMVDPGESNRDPTLPQFRPDSVDEPPHFVKPKTPEPPPTTKTLGTWLQHRKYEQEAQERGGPGKLNFLEFRRKMVAEGEVDKENEIADDNDPAYWEKSADLGRLAFVGTWLDMATF